MRSRVCAVGATKLAESAVTLSQAGEHRVACHLADYALETARSDTSVQEMAATVYDKRAESETSLMAINIFNSAAAYTKGGRAFR
jgi:Alkyl sulfatase dimerisation